MEIKSYHNLLFPFRFDKLSQPIRDRHDFYKKYPFNKRVVIDKEFNENLKKNGWKYKSFKIKNEKDYNEFVYFYDYVKDALYNIDEFKENATSYYYEKEFKNGIIEFCICDKVYEFKIETISLRIFDSGIGILSIDFLNDKIDDVNEILLINDYIRRVYPQFVGENFSLDIVKKTFLADFIKIKLDGEEFEENWNGFIEHVKNNNFVKIGNHIMRLLGELFTQDSREKNRYLIQPIIDDRMFLISWISDNDFSIGLREEWEIDDNFKYKDLWYRYVFVDGRDLNIQDKKMKRELLNRVTYTRWKDSNTFYGVSRYSFVVLGDEEWFFKNIIFNHVKTIYFQIIILSLAIRASIIRFSDEVAAISDIEIGEEEFFYRITELYRNYLRFKNKLYFSEITPQEQGIELYGLIKKELRIEEQISDLNGEIFQLDSYNQAKIEFQENKEMSKLTKVATYLMPPSLVAGFFGMNVFSEGLKTDFLSLIICLGFMVGSVYLGHLYIKDKFPFKKVNNEK